MNYLQFCSFVILLALRLVLFFCVYKWLCVCVTFNLSFSFVCSRRVWNLTCAPIQHTQPNTRTHTHTQNASGSNYLVAPHWKKKKLNSTKIAYSNLCSKFINWIFVLLCGLPCAATSMYQFQRQKSAGKLVAVAKKMEKSTTTFYFASFITSELIPSSFWILNGLFDLLSQFLRANACKLFVFHRIKLCAVMRWAILLVLAFAFFFCQTSSKKLLAAIAWTRATLSKHLGCLEKCACDIWIFKANTNI